MVVKSGSYNLPRSCAVLLCLAVWIHAVPVLPGSLGGLWNDRLEVPGHRKSPVHIP